MRDGGAGGQSGPRADRDGDPRGRGGTSCSQTNDGATARLLGNIPGTVMALGDNVYPNGIAANFLDCYDPTWGIYKSRTKPALGNHEYYNTTAANPYFDYFGARAGTPGKGYYSYDRGSWHVAVLNSNCGKVGGCGTDFPQGRWLRNDLASNPSRCTLAYFHHPLYASGSGTATPQVRPFWDILYNGGAEVILSGHAHRYERYARMIPDGESSAKSIRQFVVGTGGEPSGSEIFYAGATEHAGREDRRVRRPQARPARRLLRVEVRTHSGPDLHRLGHDPMPLSRLGGLFTGVRGGRSLRSSEKGTGRVGPKPDGRVSTHEDFRNRILLTGAGGEREFSGP